jgi:acetyl coenzyme A synthetase (ADP forming)-like protein
MTIADYPRELETDVVLRDGSTVHVRPVRATDRDGLLAFLEALSPDSRWFRFFSGGGDLRQAAGWAADVDYAGRLGLVATAGAGARIVAHAAYAHIGAGHAEVAFAVADELHGRGVATILLAHLAAAARDRDIGTFTALVLPENHRMLEVFRDSGFPLSVHAEPGRLAIECPTSLTPEARLRFAQRDRVAAAAAVARVLRPTSVALIGASERPGTIGAAITSNLLEGGFAGDLHLVNRRGGTLGGRPLHRSVIDVPGPVDLGVIAVPAAAAVDVASDCARKGVGALVVVSAGFAEVRGHGVDRQRELLEVCRAGGVRLVGPNCLGVLNTVNGLNATFAPTVPPPGTVGFMSQSGGLGIAVIDRARELGLGLSSFVSVGNKADLSSNDLLQYWEQDPATEVILLYLESLGNPRRFGRIAPRVAAKKPVLAVKSGRSAAGARAAGSHTGALLAASDVTVDALFRQAGVIRADTLGELFDVAALLAGQPLLTGRAVAILTNAGGPGILAADACAANGLDVPPLSDETQRALRAFAAPEASVANPVDLVAGASADDFARALRVLTDDTAIDAVVTIFVPPLVTRAEDVARAIAEAARRRTRAVPVVSVLMTAEEPPEDLREARVPVYRFPEEAIAALGRGAWYAGWRATRRRDAPAPAGIRRYEAAAVIAQALAHDEVWLDPGELSAICACYGIPLAESRVEHGIEAAARAAHDLGGAIALKAVAPGLVHKTEAGGVRLGLHGASAVRRAAREMRDALVAAGHEAPSFLVQRMAPDGVEMLVGVVHDPQFGPVLACGAGGTAVELMHDVAVRITPLADGDAHAMVTSLKTFPLLDGYRGAPKADVAALEDLLVRVSALVENHPQVAELECNPVVVTPAGVTVVDVRARVHPVPTRPPSPSVAG